MNQVSNMQPAPQDALPYIMLARYYGANLGRFLSTDPVGWSPSDPQSANRYTYVRNCPLNLIDPTGLYGINPNPYNPEGTNPCDGRGPLCSISVSGPGSGDYADKLEDGSGFNLKLSKKGKVKFDGKKPKKKNLSGAQLELYNAITGPEKIQINAVSGDANVDFDAWTGTGQQTVDMQDINLLDNPNNNSAFTGGAAVAHATIEAYGTAGGLSWTDAHLRAISLVGGLTVPLGSSGHPSGGMIVGGAILHGIHGDPGHNLITKVRFVTPIPHTPGANPGRQPQHIVAVQSQP